MLVEKTSKGKEYQSPSGNINKEETMRKMIMALIVLATLAITLSCSSESAEGTTGTVAFTQRTTKSVEASIGYPDAYELTWAVIATKKDDGEKYGEGLVGSKLLTDTFGPYSTGKWHFELRGFDDSQAYIYHGETDATIHQGENSIAVTVTARDEGQGTLRIEGANVNTTTLGTDFESVSLLVDGGTVTTYVKKVLEQLDEETYEVPTYEIKLDAGIHTFQMSHAVTNSDPICSEKVKVRIKSGLVTKVALGTFNGKAGMVVEVGEESAISED